MPKYELWYSKTEHCHTMFPEGHPQKSALLLEDDATLQKVFEASDWNDACRQQHEYLGWEPYVPME